MGKSLCTSGPEARRSGNRTGLSDNTPQKPAPPRIARYSSRSHIPAAPLRMQPALFAVRAPTCVRHASRRRFLRVAAAVGDGEQAADPLERARLKFSDAEGTAPKNDLIYVGKGKWIAGEAKAGRELGGLTGGWIGG